MLRNVNFGMRALEDQLRDHRGRLRRGTELERRPCIALRRHRDAGIPSSAPSSAPDTVPEYVTSSPRFHPLLMPETIRSGFALRTCEIGDLTQSVGVPSTPKVFGAMISIRSGRRSVSA